MFKHELGREAEQKTTELQGILTARSENLYGCNRYFMQPKADENMKIPEGYWVDEEDIVIIGDGVKVPKKSGVVPPGGPMSKIK